MKVEGVRLYTVCEVIAAVADGEGATHLKPSLQELVILSNREGEVAHVRITCSLIDEGIDADLRISALSSLASDASVTRPVDEEHQVVAVVTEDVFRLSIRRPDVDRGSESRSGVDGDVSTRRQRLDDLRSYGCQCGSLHFGSFGRR